MGSGNSLVVRPRPESSEHATHRPEHYAFQHKPESTTKHSLWRRMGPKLQEAKADRLVVCQPPESTEVMPSWVKM